MIFLDTETCGLHGVPVLLQYAIDDHDIVLWELWREKIGDTLDLLKRICEHKGGVCGFNLAYDWFHICKIGTMFLEVIKRYGTEAKDWVPEDHILEIVACEKDARDGPCFKPVTALDLFLFAKKGKYQSMLDRKDIRIKRVPNQLVYKLANKLHELIPLNPLYFARRKTKLDNPWQVQDIEKDGEVDRHFKDIVLKFSPSTALKAIAIDALKIPASEVLKFRDVEVHEKLYPKEYGYAPFAEAVEDITRPIHSWPAKIKFHIEHWAEKPLARRYAADDVVYLRKLYDYFERPPVGDYNSVLACQVAAVRWHGYAVDIPEMEKLLAETEAKIGAAPIAPSRVKKWILPELSPIEIATTKGSTKKVILEDMATWKLGCDECDHEGCDKCPHPAATKAKAVLAARTAKKEKEIYEKILLAGRLHASFKVMGTLSDRMSGADGLNPQGIRGAKRVRKCFTLSFENYSLCGGDFDAFEVVIALAVYKDEKLEEDLDRLGKCVDCKGTGSDKGTTCKGCNGTGQAPQKIHGLFGQTLYGKSYDEIIDTKGAEDDLYYKSKRGVFSQMYFGNEHTLMEKLGLDEKTAREGTEKWHKRYSGIAKAQKRIYDMFCSMRQPDGIGKKVIWQEPADHISSLLGSKRYYTLENTICRTLFQLAESPPKEWTNLKVQVRRRDRTQTASGAVRSALFAAAFAIQGQNLRSAGNHEIQSTGAGITKMTQVAIWELQPSGCNPWVVIPMNIHDEILCPCLHGFEKQLETVVYKTIDTFKGIVPRIKMMWDSTMKTWADK